MKLLKFAASYLIALGLLTFASTAAFAFPALNDKGVFSGTYAKGSQDVKFVLTLELVQYDASLEKFLQRQTVETIQGQQTQEQWIKKDQMMSTAGVQQILNDCGGRGGKIDTVTVGQSNVQACAMPVQNGDEDSVYWIANVPFGIAKAQIKNKKDSSTTSLKMESHGN